jgi:hypothetical protein
MNDSISLSLRERFGSTVFKTYAGHEENRVTNMTGTVILARWLQSSSDSHRDFVAVYLHSYAEGSVLHLGVMGSDVIALDRSVQYFLLEGILLAPKFDN